MFKKISPVSTDIPQTVFLPGWGFDGRILDLLHPHPAWISPQGMIDPATLADDLAVFLAEENLATVKLIGWSMGAYLALDFARSFPEKVTRLTLISMRCKWPSSEIDQLRQEVVDNTAEFLATFYRKCFLGHKKAGREFSQKMAPQYLNNISPATLDILLRGLDYLKAVEIEPAPGIATRLIHGARDIIALIEEMAEITGAAIEVLPKSGHLPFLAEDCSLSLARHKDIIRHRFSKAADSYDAHAMVQKDAVNWLTGKLPDPERDGTIKDILEIGCGTGNYTVQLAGRFPGDLIKALDFSQEMLDTAAKKLRGHKNIEFICRDGEDYLAHQKNISFDLITSNGALQWFSDQNQALKNMAALLRPGGRLLVSSFGPKSLDELNQAVKDVFGNKAGVAAAGFVGRQELEKSLAPFFATLEIEEHLVKKEYRDAHDLLTHIKKTGTSGWQQATNTLPFTRKHLNLLDDWFDKNIGGLQVTYQVFIISGGK